MTEGISNINTAIPNYNTRIQAELSKNLNLVDVGKPIDNAFVSNQDISKLARSLASKFGIAESVAFRVVRKFLTTSGSVPNLKALEDFVRTQVSGERRATKADANQESGRTNQNQFAKANLAETNQASLRPLLKEIKVNLNRDKTAEINKELENLFTRKDSNLQQIPNSRIPVTKLVSSPQAFASWLVNNKAAFIALKANPNATYLLTAMQNPILMQSPIVVSELAKLIAQLMRLKLGKQTVDSLEEEVIEERQQAALLEASDKEHAIVYGLRGPTEVSQVKELKDFLLEAERFAEEEVANLWSLTLKKEREIEKKLKAGLKSMKAINPNKPKAPRKK